ncbi:MAG: amidohydrolase, partial [Desulfovibrionaceae bacterium]|nr:amidohydrolase [Desulfovibrionaceae bacterium]
MDAAIMQSLNDLFPSLAARRRELHRYPETGWTEYRTASLAIRHAQSLGYAVTMGKDAVKRSAMMGVLDGTTLTRHMERAISQGADPELVALMDGGMTGFWADLDCGDGPALALRFDMDANDITESQDPQHRPQKEGFASQNKGAMHACGHDGHMSVGLALVELLAKHKNALRGRIRLIFQPAEEGVRGAMAMAEAGAVDGVDTLLGFHIGFHANKPGMLICGTREFMATSKADIVFQGKSAHACAAPEEGKNALLAACSATLNMHAIPRSGKGDSRITVGKLIGGEGRNVIPSRAALVLETRGATSEVDEFMLSEVRRIAKAAADMWQCSCHITMAGGTKGGESSPKLAAIVAETAREMPCFTNIIPTQAFGASEDFAHFMSLVQQKGGMGCYM